MAQECDDRPAAGREPNPGGVGGPRRGPAAVAAAEAAGAGANVGAGTVTALVSTAAEPPLPPMSSAMRMGTSGTSTATPARSGRNDRVRGVGSGSLISTDCCPTIIGATPVEG